MYLDGSTVVEHYKSKHNTDAQQVTALLGDGTLGFLAPEELVTLGEIATDDGYNDRGTLRAGQLGISHYMTRILFDSMRATYETLSEAERQNPAQAPAIVKVTTALAHVLPKTAQELGEVYNADFCLDEVECCPQAEENFIHAALGTEIPPEDKVNLHSVYHAPDGTPLAFRKRIGASSALTLAPLNVYGAIIPAGTIVATGADMNRTQTGRTTEDNTIITTYDVGDSFAINPRRLSPWAYQQQLDRALFGIRKSSMSGVYYVNHLGDAITDVTLDDFIERSKHILQLCGVETTEQALALTA